MNITNLRVEVGGRVVVVRADALVVGILVRNHSVRNFERVVFMMPLPVKWVTKPTTPAQKAKTVVASGAPVLSTTRRRGPSRPSLHSDWSWG